MARERGYCPILRRVAASFLAVAPALAPGVVVVPSAPHVSALPKRHFVLKEIPHYEDALIIFDDMCICIFLLTFGSDT